jgi:hypothetical protein
MGKVPVDDHGNEVLRKAAQDSVDGTKYDLRFKNVDATSAGETRTSSNNQWVLLNDIVTQLRILNKHMEIITEDKITKDDINE